MNGTQASFRLISCWNQAAPSDSLHIGKGSLLWLSAKLCRVGAGFRKYPAASRTPANGMRLHHMDMIRHKAPVISSGFTLLELMVVIAIAGILAAIAAPSFQELILRNSVAAQAGQLAKGLRF